MPSANTGWGCWRRRYSFLAKGWFVGYVVVYCYIAVGEGSHCVFREPCGFPTDSKGNCEDGDVLVFRMDAGELFRDEAIMDVSAEVLCGKVFRIQFVDVIYCFMT